MTTISQSEQDIADLFECQKNLKKEMAGASRQKVDNEFNSIKGLINEIILSLEVKEANLAMLTLKRKEEAVEAENRLLRQKQEILQNTLQIKMKEISVLSDSLKTAQTELHGASVYNQSQVLGKI